MIIDIKENQERYRILLSKFKGGKTLFRVLVSHNFFIIPASIGHHLNEEGGCAAHSLSVMDYALDSVNSYGVPVNRVSVIKCALLHDVCKMFKYIKVDGIWCKTKYLDYREHGLASLKIVRPFMKLTKQEEEMIRWHMGPYTEYYDYREPGDFLKWSADKNNENKNAALFLYFCDHFSTMFLEG